MIKSINQIRIELSEIQASHRQLNSFFWGDILRAYKENELNYPLMLGFYPNGTMLRNQTQIQLTISIADKVYKDWSNLNEVESDTLQICRDVFNVINHSTRWQSMGRVQSCSVTKFIDRTGDEVAGHTMTMQFLIRDTSSICDLPMFDYDFDQITGDECLPVQIYENGILVDTVASGGTYSYTHGDAHYIINNSIGGLLYSGDIAENVTLTQAISDSVATLQNSALTVLSTTNILAEGTSTITAPDATATIKNTAGTTIASEAIPSGDTEIVTITDSALTINSASIGSVAAEASLDIVVNLDGAPSGSWDGNSWEVTSASCSPVAVEVNDVSKGNVSSGATLDVNLNVTPTSSTLVGNVLSITVAGAAPIDADAQAFLTATGITDATTTYAVIFLVDNLKSKGIWNKCYGLYPLVGGTATTQKFNLKNPLNTDAAFRLEFFGGVTHDVNGIQGNGVNGYLDFKIIPASHLIVNNTHACYYCTTNINEAKLDLSSQQGGDFGLYNYSSTYYTDQYNQTSGSGRVGIANADTTGFIVGSRVASNNLKLFRNGSQIGTTATGAGGVISGMTSSVFGMAGRASATTAHLFSSRKYAFFSIGEGLTASEQLAYNNIVQAFQTILSRNV